MLSNSQSKGFTMIELMIACAISTMVIVVIMTCYIGLQRGFVFSLNWSESHVAQVRVLDSMSQDLRNARTVVVGNGSALLTLTLPSRYAAYESTGFAAGDPQLGITNQFVPPVIDGVTGKVIPADGDITVVYSLVNNTISRTVTQSSSGLNASRTVGVFGNTVSVRFQDTAEGVLSGSLSTDTVVPIVITTIASSSSKVSAISGTMSNTVFLRGKSYK